MHISHKTLIVLVIIVILGGIIIVPGEYHEYILTQERDKIGGILKQNNAYRNVEIKSVQ
jgi:hypothetical protein